MMIPPGALLNQLAAILHSRDERQSKAKRIAAALRAYGNYRWVGIYDVDLRAGEVRNVAWDGPGPPAYPVFPATKGLTARAVTSKHTVNVGDVSRDADYLTAFGSTRSEIIVPVVTSAGDVVGTIDVESEQPGAFDASAQSVLEECAAHLRGLWPEGH